MRSIDSGVRFFMDSDDYDNEDYGVATELVYSRKQCVFCHMPVGKDEHIKFLDPHDKKRYKAAHYECFAEKCRDIGATEDGVEELLDYLGIEIEF